MTEVHEYSDYENSSLVALGEALIGRSVVSVKLGGDLPRLGGWRHTEGKVVLDDGTELLMAGNEGCGGCSNGWFELKRLNDMPVNGITNVEIDYEDRGYHGDEQPEVYRIFVLAQDRRFELATIEGDTGNGYYGTGFWFSVVRP